MPIYEYRCLECGDNFEKLVRSMNNPSPKIKCPQCGGQKVEKLISHFGVQTSDSSSEPFCPTCVPRR